MKNQTCIQNPPYSFKDIVQPWEVTDPIVEKGDIVTVTGWDEPLTGVVKEAGTALIWVDLPIAAPSGNLHTIGLHRVQRIDRNGEIWRRANA